MYHELHKPVFTDTNQPRQLKSNIQCQTHFRNHMKRKQNHHIPSN